MDAGTERDALITAIDQHELALRRAALRMHPNPLFDSGLTMQQLRLLMLLAITGGSAHGDIAAEFGIGLATVTGLVDRLARRGLVERATDPADRRVRRALLSESGRDLVESMVAAGQESRRALLERIELGALRDLERGVRALRDVLDEPDA